MSEEHRGGVSPSSIGRQALIDNLAWAFQNSTDLVLAADAEGNLMFVNEAMIARAPGTVVSGAPAASVFAEEARELFTAMLDSVLTKATAHRFEWSDQRGGAARAWFLCTLSPLRSSGGLIEGVLGVSSEVTELKRSEARLRRSEQLMVDTQGVAHLGTWEWDVSEPTATWSQELYRIYGLSPDTYTPSYERYLAMVHPEDRQRVMDATNRVFQEHVPYSHDERIFRPDGTLRYLHTWAQPVLDDGGRLIRLLGVCQDITEQKLAEEAVRTLNADLERRVAERTRTIETSLRDLEAFNAMASHDLRAPLSVIHASCTMIMTCGEPLPPAVTANLTRIQRSVSRMTALVNDLLRLAQVAQAPVAGVEVDLSEMCHEVGAHLQRDTPEREVTLQVQPGLRCFADPGLLRAAVENLLGNAWKYSSRVAHARIEVGAETTGAGPVFFVRDNGAGFDMKEIHRLFAPFERLHKATEFEGTGVGLAAVHRIIERHGGRIWAEAQLGQGATFFFALPG